MSEESEQTQARLRAASDAILLLIREIDELERHKRDVQPADERFRELAMAVHEAAERLAVFAAEEESYAKSPEAHSGSLATISGSTNPASLREILVRWRDVERRLSVAPAGSAEAGELFEEFARIRD